MKIAVVVLNWNTKEYLRSFLPALADSCARMGKGADGSPEAEVIVADSGSTDGSREVLAQEFPCIKTVLLDGNYGYTGGYNRALSELKKQGVEPEYYVLINSDIEVDGDWLTPLAFWMDTHPECGICGPKLHGLLRSEGGYVRSKRFEYAGAAGGMLDRLGYPYCRGRILKTVEDDNGQYDESEPEVLWVTGSCLMIRRSVWEALDGLDDRFFAHMEEIDLCWRAQLAGWRVHVIPDSVVWHLGGGTLPPASPFKLRLNFRNNLLMLENNLEKTYICGGWTEGGARLKARAKICLRLFLDICAGIAYFCTGKTEFAKAVRTAHKEWRQLRRQAPVRPAPADGAQVFGITDDIILFKKRTI